ncbi:MAG: formate dehydrogenase accessory sulfurtransferase FdhD [Bacteroidota bacterium]
MGEASVRPIQILRVEGEQAPAHPAEDLLVEEEPLEIRLGFGPAGQREQKRISVTMRTPGHDLELALGFLIGEGIVRYPGEVTHLDHCRNVRQPEEVGNVVKVELADGILPEIDHLQRNFYMTSSCGVCGKGSIEAISQVSCPVLPVGAPVWTPAMVHGLPDRARGTQTIFRHTGGIHAATLCRSDGEILYSREDVGRHNAVDKVVGARWLSPSPPDPDALLLVSGRAGFELVQKAIVAGIALMAAVGAPSSLAVDLAREHNLTLLGFVRNQRFNVYSGAERLAL